jgi:signal transduction histidine kinase
MGFLVTQKADFFRSIAAFSTAVTTLMAALILFVVIVHLHQRAKFAREQEESLHKLGEKNDELEELIYDGSQDMRAPLVNLQGFNAELAGSCREVAATLSDPSLPAAIKQRLSSVVTSDIPDALDHMRRSVDKLDTFVNGLLRLAYMGRAAARTESVDMNNIIGGMIENMRPEAERRQASITTDYLPPCKADAEHLRQIFTALIDNALKYLSPDRPGKIRIYGRIDHKRSIYAVEDNGIGIDPKDHAKVFEAFRRVSPQESPPGEGLGLTVVRRLVHGQNGKISLESEPDKGTTVYVELPSA